MASTTFSFAAEAEDSGSDHEHWPDDFKPAPAPTAASPRSEAQNGVRMTCHCPAAPSTKADSPPPPPSPKEEIKTTVLTEVPVQYVYQVPTKMSTHAYVPAQGGATITVAAPPPAPAPAPPSPPKTAKPADPVSNTYTYHPTFSAKPVETTNKWQGRTKAEVEEDNLKIAADEKVWEKRKVVPVGLAADQMCWVVEPNGGFTLR